MTDAADPLARADALDSVAAAYERRASEYSALIGTMEAVHPVDRQLVETWATSVSGPIVDAGCGPGQWTDHLVGLGLDAWGVDLTPAFIARARQSYPTRRFHLGTLDSLPVDNGHFGGVLAWYSLIHLDPQDISVALREFRRVLRDPGGRLLIGFFEGPTIAPFDHTVVAAYRWPVDEMCAQVTAAGFTVIETHAAQRRGDRPVGLVIAGVGPGDRPLRR